MTWLPTGADELVDGLVGELVLDLLLEQPAIPATTVAAAAMPTKIPAFATGLLRLVPLKLRRIVEKCVCEEKSVASSSWMPSMASPPIATLRPGTLHRP